MGAGTPSVSAFGLQVIAVVITVVGAPVWRKRMVCRRGEIPKDRYRRAIRDLRGGGIHAGGHPHVPSPPSNRSGGWGGSPGPLGQPPLDELCLPTAELASQILRFALAGPARLSEQPSGY